MGLISRDFRWGNVLICRLGGAADKGTENMCMDKANKRTALRRVAMIDSFDYFFDGDNKNWGEGDN